jgi:predicted membrane chloride channel (bestrophin family)
MVSILEGERGVWQVLSKAVNQLSLSDYQRVTIDYEVDTFHTYLGACERLSGQPIPVAYTRHTSR